MSEPERAFGSSDSYPRLPSGRTHLSPEYIDGYQRRRVVVAVAELAHEQGMVGVSVTKVCERARISRKTFYDYFENRDGCTLYAGEQAAQYLFGGLEEVGVKAAADRQLKSGITALLGAVAAEPNIAELALVHAPALSRDDGRRLQGSSVAKVRALIEAQGKGGAPDAETIATAILGVIACQVRRGESKRAPELTDEVLRLAKLPSVSNRDDR
jgi:AcrR family transcriptional regulator